MTGTSALCRAVRRAAVAGAAAFAALLMLVAPGRATVVVHKDFAALCAEADWIFVGTVLAVQSEWRDRARRAIRTRVTFGELSWLKGGPADRITLRFAGGELDGLREEIAGVPRFAVGERRVLFAHDGAFISPLVGFNQGDFRVVDGPEGAVVLAPDESPPATTGGAALQRGAAPALPLDTFLDRVRDQLGTP